MKGFQEYEREYKKENLQNIKSSSAELLLKHWKNFVRCSTVFQAGEPKANHGKLSLCSTFTIKVKRCQFSKQ